MVRRPSHAGEPKMDEALGCKNKTAIIALLGIGLLAGGAIGLGVRLSSRNKGNNDASTAETAAATNQDSAMASTRSAGATGSDNDSGTMATDAVPDATAGGRDDPATNLTGSESTGSESTGSDSTGSDSTGSASTGSASTGSSSNGAASTGSDSATGKTGGCAAGDMTCTSGDGASATTSDQSSNSDTGCRSILEIATATSELSTLVKGIQAAHLTGTFANEDATVTVLAPSNTAFANIPEEELNMLLDNESNLTQVLKFHVVPGVAPANLLRSGEKLSTLSGTPVTVHEAGSRTKFSDGRSIAAATTPDVTSCKGLIHVIDTVLVAPSMLASTTQASDNDAATTNPSSGEDVAESTSESSDDDAAGTGTDATGTGSSETPPASGTGTDPEAQPTGRPDYSITGVKAGSDGKWRVCAGSFDARDEWNRPCGFRVATNGKVTLGEYFGGFDGYFSFDPSDSHENCFNRAVVAMFGLKTCEYNVVTLDEDLEPMDGENDINIDCQVPADGTLCACAAAEYLQPAIKSQRGKWPGNVGLREFMKILRHLAAPVNYEYPDDLEVANNGGRVANQKLVEDVFTSMINVVDCSQFE